MATSDEGLLTLRRGWAATRGDDRVRARFALAPCAVIGNIGVVLTAPTHVPSTNEHDSPPHIRWAIVVAVFVAATMARFAYFYLDDVTRQLSGTFAHRLLEECTGGLASLALFPLALLAERRFPVDRARWRRNWLPHLGGLVAYSAAHTTLIALQRAVLFPVLVHGAYDYGVLSVRYFMEGAQDVFSYAAYVGLLTLIRVQQRLRERELHAAQLERSAVSAQLRALALQLQPHFLFNALNTISSVIYEDPEEADELLGRLGDLLRRSLQTVGQQETTLAEELELLSSYEAIVRARFRSRVEIEHHISDTALACAVPSFLLQPLVEHAVRHGESREDVPGAIMVRASVVGTELRLSVENDAAEPNEPRSLGVGLGGTIDRLRLLHGSSASVHAGMNGERFVVSVQLPARTLPMLPLLEDATVARAHR